ncbi:MAG TPA: ABC transporter ATP-binding protein [Actinocrinis sp.]|nr:ABC transporter ATP-binding protein [Actinocrinis sp.]
MSWRREPQFGTAPLSRLLSGGGGKFRRLYLTSMSLWSLVYGLPLLTGALISLLLDRAATHPVPHEVWWLLELIVGLMVLRALTLPFSLQLTFKLIFRMSAWIKVHVLRGVLERPRGRGPAFGNGEVLNRLRDDSDEIGGLLEWTTDLIYRSLLTVVAVVVLLVTDTIMTLPLILLLGGLLASVALKKRVAQMQAETRVRQGRIGATITDTLTGIRDLRLSATLEGRLDSLEERFTERRKFQVSHQLYSDLLSDLFRNLVTIGTAVILLTMSLSVADSQFTVGKLTLFVTYSSWLGQQMYFFGKILARYQGGVVSYGRLTELLPAEGDEVEGTGMVGSEVGGSAAAGSAGGAVAVAEVPSSAGPVAGALQELRVRDLTCAAPVGAVAPTPVSFTVRPGELVAITGELGSGKSTLIRSLLGLQPDVEGHVYWNGTEVTGDDRLLRLPRLGYARQAPKFLRGTVRENLVLGTPEITDERIEQVMAAVGLRPGSVELPRGLETRLDSGDAGQLSGGQRQRLALARMLCRPAEVYVVDDCDSSLDASTAREIWARLPAQWSAAWIVVSHNADLLAAADTVVTIGRRVAEPAGLRG